MENCTKDKASSYEFLFRSMTQGPSRSSEVGRWVETGELDEQWLESGQRES